MLIAMIHYLFVLAASDAGTSIELKDLVPLITAVSGALTGFYAAKRTAKADKIQSEQTEMNALMSGYANQIAAYSGIVESLQQEVLRLRTQFDIDRQAWEIEKQSTAQVRTQLQAQIVKLEEDIEFMKITRTNEG